MQDVSARIEIVEGDITRQRVDAIVNAANSSLLGGGGVDGSIHRAAGPDLLAACRKVGGCPTGEAKLTHGYQLPAKWVIHTVGPIWRGGAHREEELLARCYLNSMQLAKEQALKTIAFPSISTGAYGFPVDRACRIALREIRGFLEHNELPSRVTVVCFDKLTLVHYLEALAEISRADQI